MRQLLPLLLVLTASCGGVPKVTPPEKVGTDNKVFEDIPIPQSMTYIKGRGTIRPDGKLRVYHMELRGKDEIDTLIRFYHDTLPLHQWVRYEERGAAPQPVTLIYKKDIETLTIDLRSENMRTYPETVVFIKINYTEN